MSDIDPCLGGSGRLPVPGVLSPKSLLAAALDIGTAVGTEGILSLGAGRKIGDFELVEMIGRGGMGVVWKARQLSLNRLVAFKQLLDGKDEVEAKRRFQVEAESAARLQHPHIVSIYQVGCEDEQPFLAMELVLAPDGSPAPSLAQLVRTGPLPPNRAAHYVRHAAEALHFAHQRGIIHRDVKPSNILIGADDLARLTDFGLARQLDQDSSLTLSGTALGTPSYLPPEQVSASKEAVGVWSDVYGLGAVLYHLLTGRAPFAGANVADTLRQVVEREPVAPRAIIPGIPRDLETICLRCLEKEPKARYKSAEEVAEDIRRWQEIRPIRARRIGPLERFGKLCRRHPRVTSLLSIAAFSLCLVSGLMFQQQRQADWNGRLLTETALKRLMDRVEQSLSNSKAADALIQLAGHLRTNQNDRVVQERLVNLLNQRSFLLPIPQPSIPFSAPVGDVQSRRLTAEAPLHHRTVQLAGKVGFLGIELLNSNVVWSVTNAHRKVIRSLSFDRAGEHLVSAAADGTVRIWRFGAATNLFEIPHPAPVYHATFSPDGRLLATACLDHIARVWLVEEGTRLVTELKHNSEVYSVRFSEDGSLLVTTGGDGAVCVWDIASGRLDAEPWLSPEPLDDAEFLPGDDYLSVTLSGGRTQRLARTLRDQLAAPEENRQTIRLAPPGPIASRQQIQALPVKSWITNALSPDGRSFAFSHTNGVSLWRTHGMDASRVSLAQRGRVIGLRFSPDGKRLATATASGEIRLWDVTTGVPLTDAYPAAGDVAGVAFSDDGNWIVPVKADPQPWRIYVASDGAPDWLLELAEMIAGVGEAGDSAVSRRSVPTVQQVLRGTSGGPLGAWARRMVGHE